MVHSDVIQTYDCTYTSEHFFMLWIGRIINENYKLGIHVLAVH